jgi:glutamate racemase
VNAEAPIGILGGDWAGLAVADAVQRTLPHEDVVYLADQAWGGPARRKGVVV